MEGGLRRHDGLGRGHAVKIGLVVVGGLMVLMGLLWFGQGLGVIHWPASSFMIDERPWAVRGAVLAAAGAAMVWFGRRV